MENTYNEKLCDEKHKYIKEKLDTVDKQLDKHGDRILSIEQANIKLTEILERLTNPSKNSFWNSKAGQLIPWLIFTVVILTISALIGANIIDVLKTVPTIK